MIATFDVLMGVSLTCHKFFFFLYEAIDLINTSFMLSRPGPFMPSCYNARLLQALEVHALGL